MRRSAHLDTPSNRPEGLSRATPKFALRRANRTWLNDAPDDACAQVSVVSGRRPGASGLAANLSCGEP